MEQVVGYAEYEPLRNQNQPQGASLELVQHGSSKNKTETQEVKSMSKSMGTPELKFDYEILPALEPETTSKATITRIDIAKAKDIYKDKATDPDQELVVIYGKVEHDGWEGRLRSMSKPSTAQISARTTIAQFKLRYGQFPKTGMKVDVVADLNGYWKMLP